MLGVVGVGRRDQGLGEVWGRECHMNTRVADHVTVSTPLPTVTAQRNNVGKVRCMVGGHEGRG